MSATNEAIETNSAIIFMRVKPSIAERIPYVQKLLSKQFGHKATYSRMLEFLMDNYIKDTRTANTSLMETFRSDDGRRDNVPHYQAS